MYVCFWHTKCTVLFSSNHRKGKCSKFCRWRCTMNVVDWEIVFDTTVKKKNLWVRTALYSTIYCVQFICTVLLIGYITIYYFSPIFLVALPFPLPSSGSSFHSFFFFLYRVSFSRRVSQSLHLCLSPSSCEMLKGLSLKDPYILTTLLEKFEGI